MSKYITENERYIIETMLKDGKKPKEIAKRINKHFTTVYREIKRGTVILRNSDWTDRKEYCADAAQQKQIEASHNKGIALKIGNDYETANLIEYLIKECRYSPYAACVALASEWATTTLCPATLYSYIHKDLFLNITDNDLAYKINRNKKENNKNKKRPSYKMLGAKTIEDRPKDVTNRTEFGHWEMDTVVSGQGKSKTCLLVLSERKTREELIIRIKNREAETVLQEINKLEQEYGYLKFRNTFKTITCDNGLEFAKYAEIEKSCLVVGNRTQIYFCHPYCSGERGTNENTNKLIRKYIPKGCDISQYDDDYIKQVEYLINNYPRKLLGGLSSYQYKQKLGIA